MSVIVLLFFILTIPFSLFAGDFHLKTTALGQVRENAAAQNEIPVSGYLGVEAANTQQNLRGAANVRFFRDFDRKLDDQDLYQAAVYYRPSDVFKIDSGRQLINQGFSLEMLDGVQSTFGPFGFASFALYSGIPRSVERGDFNQNDGLLTGLSVNLKNVTRTSGGVHAAWRKNDAEQTNWKQNDEIFVGADFSHQLDIPAEPLFYGSFEYDALWHVVNLGSTGVDLYPSRRLAFNLEGSYSNISRSTDRLTIQRVFTDGRTWGGRAAATWTLIPKFLDLVESYTYYNVEAQGNNPRRGHLLDAAVQISFERIGLLLEPGYYFAKSLGGDLHGVRGLVREQFTPKFFADLAADYTTYDKITNDNDNAVTLGGWIGYEAIAGLTVSGGFEYNRNNDFTREGRGSFRIDYAFDHEG